MDRIKEIKQNIQTKEKLEIIINNNHIYTGYFIQIFPTNVYGQTLTYFKDKNNNRISIIVENISEINFGKKNE